MHGLLDFAEALKLRFCVGALDLPELRKRYTSSRVEEQQMHRCARVAKQYRVGPTEWENVKCTRRNGMR